MLIRGMTLFRDYKLSTLLVTARAALFSGFSTRRRLCTVNFVIIAIGSSYFTASTAAYTVIGFDFSRTAGAGSVGTGATARSAACRYGWLTTRGRGGSPLTGTGLITVVPCVSAGRAVIGVGVGIGPASGVRGTVPVPGRSICTGIPRPWRRSPPVGRGTSGSGSCSSTAGSTRRSSRPARSGCRTWRSRSTGCSTTGRGRPGGRGGRSSFRTSGIVRALRLCGHCYQAKNEGQQG